jgi:hypothetical protein
MPLDEREWRIVANATELVVQWDRTAVRVPVILRPRSRSRAGQASVGMADQLRPPSLDVVKPSRL